MKQETEWSIGNFLEATRFGMVWLVAKKSGKKSFLRRFRRKKDAYYLSEAKWMEIREEFKVGDIAFEDSDGYVSIFRDVLDKDLKKLIDDAIG